MLSVLWSNKCTWSFSVSPQHERYDYRITFKSSPERGVLPSIWRTAVTQRSVSEWRLFFSSAALFASNVSSCVLLSNKVHQWSIKVQSVCICMFSVLSPQTWLSAVSTGGCFWRCHRTPGLCCFCEWHKQLEGPVYTHVFKMIKINYIIYPIIPH